jgi:hypothetical protein
LLRQENNEEEWQALLVRLCEEWQALLVRLCEEWQALLVRSYVVKVIDKLLLQSMFPSAFLNLGNEIVFACLTVLDSFLFMGNLVFNQTVRSNFV